MTSSGRLPEIARPRGLAALAADQRGSLTADPARAIAAPAGAFDALEIPRKLFHLSGALIPLIYLASGWQPAIAFGVLLPVAIFVVGSDVLRQFSPGLNRLYCKVAGPLMRERERAAFTTSTHFLLAAALVIGLFPRQVAVPALLFLAVGDPAAALVGKRYGQIRLLGKSLEGFLACFQVCFWIGLLFLQPWVALVAALAAALAEFVPLPVNDNFRIPLVSAVAIHWMIAG